MEEVHVTEEVIDAIANFDDLKKFLNHNGLSNKIRLTQIKSLQDGKDKIRKFLTTGDIQYNNFPNPITEEFISNIFSSKDLKNLIIHKKWGGKGGHFVLKDITDIKLEKQKIKCIELLKKEKESQKFQTPIEKNIALGEKTIFQGYECIKDKKGKIINMKDKIIIIPCHNNKHELIDYFFIDLDDYEKVMNFTFHVRFSRFNIKKVVCGAINKAVWRIILNCEEKGFAPKYLNSNTWT